MCIRDRGWADALAGALLADLDGGDAAPFLDLVEQLVAKSLARGGEADRWHEALHDLVAELDPARRTAALSRRLEGALTVVGGLATHAETARRLQADAEANILRRLFLPAHVQLDDTVRALRAELPSLGVGSHFLCRLDAATRAASLVSHHDADGLVTLDDPCPASFPAVQLVPGRLSGRRHALAVLPLHYLDERFGYLLCAVGPMGCTAYESLTSQLSTVLKVTALVEEVRRHAEALEAKVEERTRQLREAQQHLVETAHKAGMAEVAVGVLHNVGNLLTSVHVCAEEISAAAAAAPVAGLLRANGLLAEHRADLPGFFARDPRAALLPDYYDRVAAGLSADLDRIRGEAGELGDKTSLVRDSIKTLQEFARAGMDTLLWEEVDIPSLLDAALAIQATDLLRHGVRTVREVPALPPVVTHRARVVHVVVNLLKNAVEAMREVPEAARLLTVRAGAERGERVVISVSDTGAGIAPENLDRIFAYGFTTKVDGHGFGLHTAANTMTQLGGAIRAQSEGPGRGATFTVTLPTTPGVA